MAVGKEDPLYDEVYGELHDIAGRLMAGERPDHTLRPTELVHEAWIRVAATDADDRYRTRFLGVAATAMRHVLVDYARRRAAARHGGDLQQVTLGSAERIGSSPEHEVLALHSALEKLALDDPRAASVVELRVFAGMSAQEAATSLGISKRTADSDWKTARLWLADEMAG